jgi:uncharacterized protein YerC
VLAGETLAWPEVSSSGKPRQARVGASIAWRRASFSVEDYSACTVPVPPRRRAGSRPGELSEDFRAAIAAEAERLEGAGSAVEVIRGVGDAFAALDDELAQFAAVRLRAVAELRAQGWTYAQIHEATGLSEARVAQLARAARRM